MSDVEHGIWEPGIDPAKLAENAALQVFHGPDVSGRNVDDTERLKHLDAAAESLDLCDKPYWVEASRAVAMPAEIDFDSGDEVTVEDFQTVTLEGTLCYARLQIGKIIGPEAVSRISALCLTFHDALVVPSMKRLPYDMVMYVPVLAVQTIDKTPSLD